MYPSINILHAKAHKLENKVTAAKSLKLVGNKLLSTEVHINSCLVDFTNVCAALSDSTGLAMFKG